MSHSEKKPLNMTFIAAGAAVIVAAGLVGVVSMRSPDATQPAASSSAPADALAESAQNVRLVAHHDMQGRQALQLTARSDPQNGNWLYVGYQPNARTDPDTPILNSITGKEEYNGTGIFDITDPSKPRLVWHIPGQKGANHRSVSVVYDYKHDGSGRDYLIRSLDVGDQGGSGDKRFQIFDITSRGSDPSQIKMVGEITGTPPNSCGPGCGGPFEYRAHKGYWSEDSGIYYSASGEPGFRNTLAHVWDLKDPKSPKFVGRAWLPGMKDTEDKALYQGQYVHHPIIDEANNRMYIGFRNASGLMGAWDISNPAQPKLVWSYDMNPPARGPHTITPIEYKEVANFHGDALPRKYAFVTDEAGGGADMAPCKVGTRAKAYMFDVTHESHPMPVSVWEVPVGNFCQKGGRFGPHQHAEFRNGRYNRHEDKMAWVAYFNAGIRVVDLSDPYHMKEIGHYLPKTNKNSHPISTGQQTAIQINDVTLDHRGIAYATDRVGTGLFILEYTGSKPAQRTTSN
jgi:hypothetical protein